MKSEAPKTLLRVCLKNPLPLLPGRRGHFLTHTPCSLLIFTRALSLVCAAPFLLLTAPARASERQVLHGHTPAAAGRLQPVDRLASTKHLDLAIALPLRNRTALAGLLQQLYDPASPGYHQYLTPEQFAERFGPADAD